MHQFKTLKVWEKSIVLAGRVYKLTEKLPSKERFGLISQINRSVVSIASNIAEGCGRNTDKEYRYFLSVSQGSSFELETQIMICLELNYYKPEDLNEVIYLINEIQKMLNGLQKNIKSS